MMRGGVVSSPMCSFPRNSHGAFPSSGGAAAAPSKEVCERTPVGVDGKGGAGKVYEYEKNAFHDEDPKKRRKTKSLAKDSKGFAKGISIMFWLWVWLWVCYGFG